jgi:nucleotide-binding universal stress UspA family protein
MQASLPWTTREPTVEAIVVGVEESPDSLRALDWAAEAAEMRSAPLRIVHAYHVAGGPDTVALLDEHARAVLDAAVNRAAAVAPGVDVTAEAARGESAAYALIERGNGAALLVVGSRGLGGFPGLLMGSVAEQCLRHAPCPVVVVRERRPGGAGLTSVERGSGEFTTA